MSNFNEFKRSLDQLVEQAQHTAQLGFDVAREQVETLVRTTPNLNDQVDEVRRNLQTMAREMETRAQELVHLATSVVQPPSRPGASAGRSTPSTEAPTGTESATRAGAGTPQTGSNFDQPTPTPAGEAPGQE
ncbi:MAG TPA: hypothetical protein V6D47_11545 [Oscillatoriaceae cyanobacterium]